MHVAVIIPALDEEASIGQVVRELREAIATARLPHEERPARATVIVADNGSRDRTAAVARDVGALVVHVPRRGYGSACLAALDAMPGDIDVVLFADGDGSDDPGDVQALLEPIARGEAELCVGSRAMGEQLGLVEHGALTGPQRFGNRLATTLVRLVFGVHFSDLGPFRALTTTALRSLGMDDPDFGWTVQMQARAAARGLKVREVPVHYRRRRAGRSKVAGNLKGSVLAGTIILRTVALESARAGVARVRKRNLLSA